MEVEQLKNPVIIGEKTLVKVKTCGNIVEIQYLEHQNTGSVIKMIPNKQYVDMRTGEIKDCEQHKNRACLKNSLYRTFANVRDTINTNVTDTRKVLWVTLTYAENMQDTKRLYSDFKLFNQRFRWFLEKRLDILDTEYIAVAEPQGRGAWHLHVLFLFPGCEKVPYIANEELRAMWRHGFVRVGNLNNCDNIGAYLSAYLGDMEVREMSDKDLLIKGKAKEKDGKYYIKGGRLSMYPPGFNIMRCSRGIKKPFECYMTNAEAKKKVSAGTLTFQRTVMIQDGDFSNIIDKRYYNMAKKPVQDL